MSYCFRSLFLLIVLFVCAGAIHAQNTGVIRGTVKDKNTQETIIGAVLMITGTETGTVTDVDGNFKITIAVGTYRLEAGYLGYTSIIKDNIIVTSGNDQIISFELEPVASQVGEVQVVFEKGKSAVATDMITPLSVQQLTTEEIKSNPGGNYDVSKVIQTLPGVGGSAGGAPRNDIIVRGGAPNENVYYLDGIEIPVLNHFQTQGSSGGATGILNVSFIEDVKLSSSAFDARYDNALASTFIIKQREGNPENVSGNFRISGTEIATTLEGPMGKKTNFLASARRSYLQYLFQLIDLPIRPNFWDFQYKVTHKLNDKTTITALGIGAIDEFYFATPKKSTPENIYITRSLPYINQWNYTTGFAVKRLVKNGFMNITASRNMFNNEFDKFIDENKTEENRTFFLRSQEIENKFRLDINKYIEGWKICGGVMAQYVKYNTQLFNQVTNDIVDSTGTVIVPATKINFASDIEFYKYGAFVTTSKNILNQKLLVSFGVRTDMNSLLDDGNNPLNTLSPRLSFAYHLSPKFDLTASVGSYYKIPTYTTLGFRDSLNNLANRSMKYIRSDHYVLGTQYLPNESLRITVEGFYKQYSNYPVSITNGISLANQGGDFGSIGSEPIISNGKGECYGAEFFIQQKLINRLFYVFSYTYVRSNFSGADGKMIASSWDNQHIISSTLGYKFKRNWQLGLKYRYAGGLPFTPFDLEASRQNYLLLGTGVLDYTQLNTQRLNALNQLDLRIDKKYNFKNTSLDLFLDFQNVLLFKQQSTPRYTFERNADNTGFQSTDGNAVKFDGSNAIPVLLQDNDASSTPSIGIIFEF
jgi:hypothetical protein